MQNDSQYLNSGLSSNEKNVNLQIQKEQNEKSKIKNSPSNINLNIITNSNMNQNSNPNNINQPLNTSTKNINLSSPIKIILDLNKKPESNLNIKENSNDNNIKENSNENNIKKNSNQQNKNNIIIETERLISTRPKYPKYCNLINCDKTHIPIIHKLICNLCKGVIFCPIQDKCEHLYCEKCYDIFCPNPPFKCAINGNIIEKPYEINGLKLIFNDMIVNCPNQCNWTGNYNDLKEHKESCLNEFIKCPHINCPYDIIRKNIENHKKICIYRSVICHFCNTKMQFINLENHFKNCLKISIDCELNCGKKIKREDMNFHIFNECDNYFIDCKYKDYGCNINLKRKDMNEHLKNNSDLHLSLFESFIKDFIPYFKELKKEKNFLNKKRNFDNNIIYISEGENGKNQ